MSEAKFTPGKWDRYSETRSPNIFIEAHNHGSICKVANNKYAEGNARLIIAAPELLEALETLFQWAENPPIEIFQKAEAAIRKATGK